MGKQRAMQENIQEHLEPFVGRDYFERFMLNRPGLKHSTNKHGSELLGSCITRSQSFIEFCSDQESKKLAVIQPAFNYSWLEERVRLSTQHAIDRPGYRQGMTLEAINESIEFLQVLHTLADKLFPELNPNSLRKLEEVLRHFETERMSERRKEINPTSLRGLEDLRQFELERKEPTLKKPRKIAMDDLHGLKNDHNVPTQEPEMIESKLIPYPWTNSTKHLSLVDNNNNIESKPSETSLRAKMTSFLSSMFKPLTTSYNDSSAVKIHDEANDFEEKIVAKNDFEEKIVTKNDFEERIVIENSHDSRPAKPKKKSRKSRRNKSI